jgi:hypothetical protein
MAVSEGLQRRLEADDYRERLEAARGRYRFRLAA